MPGWLTLGNQLPGVYLTHNEIVERYKLKYPEYELTQ